MRKKFSFRLLTLLLSICMVLSVAGCKSSDKSSQQVDDNTEITDSSVSSEDGAVSSEGKDNAVSSESKDNATSSGNKDNATSSENKDNATSSGNKNNTVNSQNNSSANNKDKNNSVSSGNKDNTVNSQNNNSSANNKDKENNNSSNSNNKNNNSSSNISSSSNKKPSNSNKKTSLTKEEFIAQMPSKLKGTTIKYMYWHNPKKQMEAEAIASFEKKTGIKVEPIVESYDGFFQEVSARIAAGNAPDIVRLLSPEQVSFLQPITNSGYDFNDTAWSEAVLSKGTYNGNLYSVNLDNSAVMDYAVIYYNKNALKSAEMEDPYTIWKKNPKNWTWNKFWQMCDEFVKVNKKSSETYYGATFEYPDAYVRAMGGSIYNYDTSKGKYVNTITSNAMKVGWQRTLSAIEKKWLVKKHDVTLFDSGKALFYWSGPYSVRKGDNRQDALKKQNALGIVPLPTDSRNQTLYEMTAFGLCKGAKNPEAVPYYLRWVLDKSSYNMDNVYVTKEAKTVMDYVSSQKNLFYGSYWYDAFFNDMYNGGANQVQSILDSYKNTIDVTVKKKNDTIALY